MTTVEDPNTQSNKKKIWAILLSALAIIFLCAASILLYFERFSPNARASLTAQASEKTQALAMAYTQTATELISPTLTNTSTEAPTNTPLPTATVVTEDALQETSPSSDDPGNIDETITPTMTSEQLASLPAITCRDIEEQQENLTDLQWKRYVNDIIGRKITFSGEVIEVFADQKIEIHDENCQNIFTVLNLFGIPEEDLVNIHIDQFLRGEGTIRVVNFLYGNNIDVNVDFYQ